MFFSAPGFAFFYIGKRWSNVLFILPHAALSVLLEMKEMAYRKIPFSPPDLSDQEIAEVTEALRSGWITAGPRTYLPIGLQL